MGFIFWQPFLINSMVEYLQGVSQPRDHGNGLIGATLLIYLGVAATNGIYGYFHQRAIAMVRSCIVGIVFERTTEMMATSEDGSASLTLMSGDVEMIQAGFEVIHDAWADSLRVAIAAWLLESRIGVAFLVPFSIVVFCFAVSWTVGRMGQKFQGTLMRATQTRVSATAEAIANMKSFKMCGLGPVIERILRELRKKELHAMKRSRIASSVSAVCGFTPLLVSPVAMFAATDRGLGTVTAFTSLSSLLLLRNPLTQLFQSIPRIMAAFASVTRISEYLNSPSKLEYRNFEDAGNMSSGTEEPCSNLTTRNGRLHVNSLIQINDSAPGRIRSKTAFTPGIEPVFIGPRSAYRLENAWASWEPDEPVFQALNVCIPAGKLTCITGPVGCGKSTLCKALLGEVPHFGGNLICHNKGQRVGFCDQTPTLPNVTIQEAIVGESHFDRQWFENVISLVALDVDLESVPFGVASNIGPDGSALSGGQRQRLALARAVYAQPGVLILDDVFAALDGKTRNEVFAALLGVHGVLRAGKSTVVLVTHSVDILRCADQIIGLGSDAFAARKATEDTPQDEQLDMHSTIDELSEAPVPELGTVIFRDHLHKKHSDKKRSNGDLNITEHELCTPLKNDEEESHIDSKALTGPGSDNGGKYLASSSTGHLGRDLEKDNPSPAPAIYERKNITIFEKDRQVGDMTVYKHYFSMFGHTFLAAFSLLCILFGFLYNYPTVWLKNWADDFHKGEDRRSFYLGIYVSLQVFGVVTMATYLTISITLMPVRSGLQFHHRALATVVSAPLAFLTKSSNGGLLNKFSQDLMVIDTGLSMSLSNTALTTATALGQAAVIATVSVYMVVCYPILAAVLYVLQRFYLRTSRQLRHLDLEAKSPL
jgi:ABC-type multidrug transport system fused ATPase/permease subunit